MSDPVLNLDKSAILKPMSLTSDAVALESGDPEQAIRGRPREGDIDANFKASAIAVFAEGGFAKLSVSKICAHAGHPRATFYRRWNTALDVLFAAFDERFQGTGFVDTGDIRADLLTHAKLIRRRYDDPVLSICAPFIYAEMHRRSELIRPFAIAQKKRIVENRKAITHALVEQNVTTAMSGTEMLTIISSIIDNGYIIRKMPDDDMLVRLINILVPYPASL